MDTTSTTTAPLTATQAAALLGISAQTLYRRIAAGQLRAVKAHGHWRIDERDLERQDRDDRA